MTHTILANWKMAPSSLKEAKVLFDDTKSTVGKLRSVNVILAPPSVFLQPISSGYRGNKLAFSAQEISIHEAGAYTGEVSAKQFADSGATYAMVGHSECGSDLDSVRVQTFMAIKNSLSPIVFIGEKERDKNGKYLIDIRHQILTSLKELSIGQINDVIFCYEPVWVIGSDSVLSVYDIHAMSLYIRKVLAGEYDSNIAKKVQILYGGSVDKNNIEDILRIEDIDGVAIGRASVNIEHFIDILKIANRV